MRAAGIWSPIFALVLACAGGTPPPGAEPSRVEGEPVQLWTARIGGELAQAIFARNDGNQTLWITYLRLHNCENVVPECGEFRPSVPVPAGRTVELMRLRPRDPRRGMRYQYHYRFQITP